MFFTPSLLLALQLAHFRDSGGYGGSRNTNVRITCFDSEQVRTPSGERVRFMCFDDMMKVCDIKKLERNGESRSYAAEYATMDCVMTGDSARTVSLYELALGGLYNLYPTIELANNTRRRGPRVNMELRQIRDYYFEQESTWPCGTARIDAAAKLAARFKTNGGGGDKVAEHILAWLLSLQKRDAGGLAVISNWLKSNSSPRLRTTDHDSPVSITIDMATMPEFSQFYAIWPLMRNRAIADKVLSAESVIRPQAIEKEKAEWRTYKCEKDEEHWAKRNADRGEGRRGGHKGTRRDRDRPDSIRHDRVEGGRVGRAWREGNQHRRRAKGLMP